MSKEKKLIWPVLVIVVIMVFAVGVSIAVMMMNMSKESKYRPAVDAEGNTIESGYMLYRYEGNSSETVFTVPDTVLVDGEEKPVIQLDAFSLANASYLKEINIGKNITVIEDRALSNIQNLQKINVADDNPKYMDIDGVLYEKNAQGEPYKVLVFPCRWQGQICCTYEMPSTVTEIGICAFYKCYNIEKVIWSDSLRIIGDYAFQKCSKLLTIELPNGVEKIGIDAFSYCGTEKVKRNEKGELTDSEGNVTDKPVIISTSVGDVKIFIPKSVTYIGDYAFFDTQRAEAIRMEHNIIWKNEEKNKIESIEGVELGEKWNGKQGSWFGLTITVKGGESR